MLDIKKLVTELALIENQIDEAINAKEHIAITPKGKVATGPMVTARAHLLLAIANLNNHPKAIAEAIKRNSPPEEPVTDAPAADK